MNKPPRSYIRAKNSEYLFQEFNDFKNHNLINFEEKQAMLNIIKRVFVFYWKFLRDLLKEDGIIEYYPRKIIIIAIEKNIIESKNIIWLNYIDLLNKLIYDKAADNEKIVSEIITTYKVAANDIYLSVKEKCNVMSKNNSEFEEFFTNNVNIELNKEQPDYNHYELGIKEGEYEKILSFFRNNPKIKNVWLHGSRASGNSRKNSDIDLLVDAETENFDDLKIQLNKIRIPYRIDAANIYDELQHDFIARNSHFAKIIYRAEDFN